MTSPSTSSETPLSVTKSPRFLSLDVFRGLTVAGMILVNNPGSWSYVYAPLRHAPWDGCTPTDLVFPFFLFAVGNALAFSMVKYEGQGSACVVRKIFTRTTLIFIIGLMLNWFPFVRWQDDALVAKNLENLRIFGVLPRIALAYMGGALFVHFLKPVKAFAAGLALLLAYWLILLAFGDLTLEGNAVLKVDRWLIGEGHMYKGYYSEVLKQNIAFDPEGLLSTIPAIASVIFGCLVGKYIRSKGNTYEMITHLLVAGMLAMFAGLCWGLVFPINKPIWSSAYVFYTTGLAMAILSVILFFVEMKQEQTLAKPFIVFGKNPLLIFVLSGVLVKIYSLIRIDGTNLYTGLYKNVFQPVGGDYFGSLLFAIAHVLLFYFIGWLLDRKKIYLRA